MQVAYYYYRKYCIAPALDLRGVDWADAQGPHQNGAPTTQGRKTEKMSFR